MILGIDGGGTKTHFALFNDQGEIVDELVLGTAHPAQVGKEGAISIFQQGTKEILTRNKVQDVILSAGLAGYGYDSPWKVMIEEALYTLFPKEKVFIDTDAVIALYGAFRSEDGIIVIAGTGSIALSKQDQEINRSGGWGFNLGDEGSASWIGRKALELFTKQSDGRLPQTEIYQAIKRELSFQEDSEVIGWISSWQQRRTTIAKLAIVVNDCAEKGDQLAKEILEEAGKELAQLVLAVGWSEEVEVACFGGVLQKCTLVKEMMQQVLPKNYKVIDPKESAIKGTYYYAMERQG